MINFLYGWSVHWCKWGVKFSPCDCVTVDFSFYSVSICLIYWGAPMLGAYIFIIMLLLLNISSSWIDPLIIMSCPSLSFITDFILKSILYDVSIATPVIFWLPFAWKMELVESGFLTPYYSMKLQSSKQYGTATKIDILINGTEQKAPK